MTTITRYLTHRAATYRQQAEPRAREHVGRVDAVAGRSVVIGLSTVGTVTKLELMLASPGRDGSMHTTFAILDAGDVADLIEVLKQGVAALGRRGQP